LSSSEYAASYHRNGLSGDSEIALAVCYSIEGGDLALVVVGSPRATDDNAAAIVVILWFGSLLAGAQLLCFHVSGLQECCAVAISSLICLLHTSIVQSIGGVSQSQDLPFWPGASMAPFFS
jgi:hypothetical protein